MDGIIGRRKQFSSEVKMSHASMLKARRQHQKTRKLLVAAAKQAERQAKQALAGPVVKKEKVKKEKIKKEKIEVEKVKKIKLTSEELGRQDAKKGSAGAGKKGAS
jgi:glycerol-3-phosphate O-acyltransferase